MAVRTPLAATGALVTVLIMSACSGDVASPSEPTAATPLASTQPQDTVAVIETYLQALNERDVEAAAALFAPGALAVNPTGAGSTTLQTTADAIEYVRAVPECAHELVGTRTEGEYVFAAVTVSGPECPIAAGSEIEMPFRITNGTIACLCQPGDE